MAHAVLAVSCNPRRIHILCPELIIGLHVSDERIYKLDSLPRKLGVLPSFYHDSQDLVFGGLSLQGRENFILPSETVQNTYG